MIGVNEKSVLMKYSIQLRRAGKPSRRRSPKIRKKLLKFVYLERVPFEQVGLSHPLGASAPFIAEWRQPAWNGRREGYVPLWGHSGGEAGPETGF